VQPVTGRHHPWNQLEQKNMLVIKAMCSSSSSSCGVRALPVLLLLQRADLSAD
jgi:hypothetical protein